MSRPAILGGTPVGVERAPDWPPAREDVKKALLAAFDSQNWTRHTGTQVEAFEKEFAQFIGCKRAVAVANGTVSLQAILHGLRLQPGDEVIVPAYTFIASALAVLEAGGVPVFCDIDPDTYLIHWDHAEQLVTERTRAVMPVHIAGSACDMDRAQAFAERHGLAVIEDAAQAHGTAWKGRRVGALGTAGSFSFQASKNMAAGEGGMITTDDEELAERIWSIHTLGRQRGGAWYGHYHRGTNYRLTEFQAAILRPQLGTILEENRLRAANAAHLDAALSQVPGLSPLRQLPHVTDRCYHLYIFKFDPAHFAAMSRQLFIKAMAAEGIPCTPGYNPLYREPLFRRVAEEYPASFITNPERADYSRVSCPVTERAGTAEAVWIPHRFLLTRRENMQRVGEAAARIQAYAAEIVQKAQGA